MTYGRDTDVVITAAARTPFGAFGGVLRSLSIPELARLAGQEALRRAAVEHEDVEEVVLGVNLPGSDRSLARQAMLRIGIPDHRNAPTSFAIAHQFVAACEPNRSRHA